MNAVTHLEKVITGEVSAVTHIEKVIAGETSAVTYTEKVIAGEAPPITHLQKVIAGEASPVTHLEYVWAGGSPEPTEHEYTGAVPVTFNADGTPLLDFLISGNMVQNGTPTPTTPIQPQECGELETVGEHAGQYKIPISSANTTTPIYLGEVQSTRRIKKYEFTGNETDLRMQSVITATDAIQLPTTLSDYKKEPFICSHMKVSSSSGGSTTHGFYGQFLTLCFEKSMGLDTLEKMRTYLQQQYAAGTPVTVWYVLAEPETAVVNEPIRKIGDYADTVSMEQAGVSIPTNNGSTTVDVETTLKPSEVYIKYKGV